MKKKDRGKDAIKTKRPLAYGEEYTRDFIDGMEALGEAIENGEVKIDEEDDEEAWKVVEKKLNLVGEEVTRVKQKPTKIDKEAYEYARGPRKEKNMEANGEMEEEEEEDEALWNESEEE